MHSQEDSVSPRIEKNGSGKQDTLSPPSPGAASRSGCWCAVVPPGAGGAGGLLHIAVRELVEGDRLAVLALTSGSRHRLEHKTSKQRTTAAARASKTAIRSNGSAQYRVLCAARSIRDQKPPKTRNKPECGASGGTMKDEGEGPCGWCWHLPCRCIPCRTRICACPRRT